jgi:hypothetical protein
MRQGRLTESRESYYHVMSRVVDRRFVLNDDEKRKPRESQGPGLLCRFFHFFPARCRPKDFKGV